MRTPTCVTVLDRQPQCTVGRSERAVNWNVYSLRLNAHQLR